MTIAKDVIGNFANLKPDNPVRFIESVGQILEQFPPAIGLECADPCRGIAATTEFLSLKAINDWCDARQQFYRGLADHAPTVARIAAPEPQLSDDDLRRGSAAMRGLHRALVEKRDLSSLSFDDCIKLGTQAETKE